MARHYSWAEKFAGQVEIYNYALCYEELTYLLAFPGMQTERMAQKVYGMSAPCVGPAVPVA